MTIVLRHIKANLIQWIALLVLVAAMMTASKAAFFPMVRSLARFVLPFLVVWIIYRFIKGRLESAVKKFQEQIMQNIQNAGYSEREGTFAKTGKEQVLDLCPKCGILQSPAHRC